MRISRTGPLTAMISLALAGCHGDVDETHQGRLETSDSVLAQDESYYDAYEFRAKEGAKIVLELESPDFDAYVHLMDAEGRQLAHNNDAEPGATRARLEHTARASGTYNAVANSAHGSATGAYTLKIRVTGP
ncbi:MAG: hypothetical protein H5U40_00790 [Polyangiaceae bacterium]|nr:hypothetical protein [Polyangiaceae bacterium]